MKKTNSSTTAASSSAKKRRATSKSPFATPPHPLGYNFIPEGRPLRASSFASILPSVISKYGLGRKLGVERFQAAWRDALVSVFGVAELDEFAAALPDKLTLFAQHTRLSSFRGGVLRVEVASNLLYQELQFHVADLLRALCARLPDEKIQQLKIVVR